MLELYHNAMSVCAQKVRVVLAEKGISYTGIALDIRGGDTRTPAYLALNPNGVVPTLVVAGAPIIESTIICEYLDDAFPPVPLRPADPVVRAAMRLWTIKPDAGMHKAFGLLSFAVAFRHQNTTTQFANRKPSEAVQRPDERDRTRPRQPGDRACGSAWCESCSPTWRRASTVNDWLAGDALQPGRHQRFCRMSAACATSARRGCGRGAVPFSLGRSRGSNAAMRQRGYAGIADFLDAKYLSVMAAKGREAEPQLRDFDGGLIRVLKTRVATSSNSVFLSASGLSGIASTKPTASALLLEGVIRRIHDAVTTHDLDRHPELWPIVHAAGRDPHDFRG